MSPIPCGSRLWGEPGRCFKYAIVRVNHTIFSREYVNYLARHTVNQLIEAKMIRAAKVAPVVERVNAAILEELSLEDRINEKSA